MPGTPEQRDDDGRRHKAAAARGLFVRAELTVNEDDPDCWQVRDGVQPSAQWYLFWPATGTFRRPDGATSYGPSTLVAEIRKASGGS
jgi:hypothetical protein